MKNEISVKKKYKNILSIFLVCLVVVYKHKISVNN
jgi:hypothetical protein